MSQAGRSSSAAPERLCHRLQGSLAEDGWTCLTEALELRLAQRRPTTVEGASRSFELARYLMAQPVTADGTDLGTGSWYRQLRNHLVDSAHEALTGRLLPRRAGRRQASTEQRLEGRDHADR